MTEITKFFAELWKLKKELGVSIQPYSTYFFDKFPSQPVTFFNFCQVGDRNELVGVIVSLKGEMHVLNLNLKIS